MLRTLCVLPTLLLVALLSMAGCSGDSPSAPPNGDEPPGPPAQLVVSGGNQQTAMVGFDLPDSLTVKVSDATGKPVPGTTVTWTVESGGGTLSSTSTTTGATGLAKVRWTLGPVEGAQSASASVSGVAPVIFAANGAPNTSGSGTVTAAGGAIGLPDGTRVVFPPGAVAGPVQLTLAKVDPASFLDGPSRFERVLITATASVNEFTKPVEIRVPLPVTMTPADSMDLIVGRIDSTGVVIVHSSTIRVIDGRPHAVVETTSFSSWLFEWLLGTQTPVVAGPLGVPYYSQDDTHACWAAVIQMLTQAVRPSEFDAIPDVIGHMGIDPTDGTGGITGWKWVVGLAFSDIIESRTGVRPRRQGWILGDPWLLLELKEHIKQLIGVEGWPVAFFPTFKNHSVLLVGYRTDTFLVHDPQGLWDPPGNRAVTWEELTAGAGLGHAINIAWVPQPIALPAPVSLSILPRSIFLVSPRSAIQNPVTYSFMWDHRLEQGYSFPELGLPSEMPQLLSQENVSRPAGPTRNPEAAALPGEVALLRVPGEIQVVNGSPDESRDLNLSLQIGAVGDAGLPYLFVQTKTFLPGASRAFSVPDLEIDTFRINGASDTEYELVAQASTPEGEVLAGQRIRFSIESVTPELTTLAPASAGVGQEVVIAGKGFGRIPFRNRVSFNGTEATVADIRLWKDDTVKVAVPAGATDGPLVVYRGEVPSNALPFTLSNVWTIGGDLNERNDNGSTLWGSVIRANGTWAFSGTNPRIRYSDPDMNYLSLRAEVNQPIELKATATASVEPTTFTFVNTNGSWSEYTYRTKLDVGIANPEGPAYSKVGTEEDFTVSFTLTSLSQYVSVGIWVDGYYDVVHYRADGSVESTSTDNHAGGMSVAIFHVQGE